MLSSLYSLSRFRDFGVLLLRLAFGLQLVLSSWPYMSDPAKLTEFTNYLTTLGFPFPGPGAIVSAYTEFLGGILLILGLWTRPVALVVAFNFLVALLLGHVFIADTYENSYPSANLLVVTLFLAFNGAGAYSIDARLGHR
jgi:putative oxidoreductase